MFFVFSSPLPPVCCSRALFVMFVVCVGRKQNFKFDIQITGEYYRIRVNWIWIELMTLITHLLFSASHTQCSTNIKQLNISSFQVERKHSLLLKRSWYGWWFFSKRNGAERRKKSCLIKMLLVDGVRAVNLRRKGERRSSRETHPAKCM